MCKPWAWWGVAILVAAGGVRAGDRPSFQAQPYDWPQWGGPHRDSVSTETGLLQEWPREGPPLVYTASGLGRGYSTVSVAAGRIFTMGDLTSQGGKQMQYVIALDEARGKKLWTAPVGEPWGDGGPRGTPTVDGSLVYAVGPHGDLVCVETATGKVRWRKNFARDFNGRMMSGWGFSESPLVDGDKLICTPGGKDATLVALNKRTGNVIWKAQVPEGDGAAYSSIVVVEVEGVRQYVQLLQRGIVGVAAADGKFLWRYDKMANGTANIPTPIVHGNLIFCSTGYGAGSALLRLVPDGEGIKAEEVYFLPAKVLQNHHGGLVLVNDYIYCGHGHNEGFPICVEMANGKVAWRKDRGPGTGSAAVVYADHQLYFRYQNGVMALIEANPTEYKLNGSFKLPDNSGAPSWPHPVVANGRLYIRDQDKLLCFDVKHHQR